MTKDKTAKHVDQARKLGYSVNVAQEGYTDPQTDVAYPNVYRIEGHGVSIMLHENDKEAWDRFLVPEAHDHRANFARHMDADDDFTMSEEDIMQSSFQAAVGVGSMTQEEADKSMGEWVANVEKARNEEG